MPRLKRCDVPILYILHIAILHIADMDAEPIAGIVCSQISINRCGQPSSPLIVAAALESLASLLDHSL